VVVTVTTTSTVRVAVDGAGLTGDVTLPERPFGMILFAHGGGSSRRSPRNRMVASELNRAGLATLLIDLLTAEEERLDAQTGQLRFDIGLLARRLTGAVDWAAGWTAGDGRELAGTGFGLFGASTGAAAALVTASERADRIRCVVSRGGRPDLAGDALSKVRAPALLIVGGRDTQVLALNESAAPRLGGPSRIVTVPDATHLFEEPGALDRVAALAAGWFSRYLAPVRPG
jgi:putative phosphoribosyl transferase